MNLKLSPQCCCGSFCFGCIPGTEPAEYELTIYQEVPSGYWGGLAGHYLLTPTPPEFYRLVGFGLVGVCWKYLYPQPIPMGGGDSLGIGLFFTQNSATGQSTGRVYLAQLIVGFFAQNYSALDASGNPYPIVGNGINCQSLDNATFSMSDGTLVATLIIP